MTTEEEYQTIWAFQFAKNELLNRDIIIPKSAVDRLIKVAIDLDLPASRKQIEDYKDHYYPKESDDKR